MSDTQPDNRANETEPTEEAPAESTAKAADDADADEQFPAGRDPMEPKTSGDEEDMIQGRSSEGVDGLDGADGAGESFGNGSGTQGASGEE